MGLNPMTVVDQLIDVLAKAGVRHVFGMPGDAINDLVDAIRRQDEIRFIQVRHEESGAFAAAAQAKLTGKLGVCVGTAGGGAIHLLNGLYDAKLDHAPVLAITGQVPQAELGSHAHQEVDAKALFRDVAVFSQTIISPGQMPDLAVQACREALLCKGVSHLSLPEDISASKAEKKDTTPPESFHSGRTVPDIDELEHAAATLNRAEKPLILAGIGAFPARPALLNISRKLGAPIIRTLRAKGLLPDTHPLSLGGLGLLGTRPALEAIENCDVLLMAGTDFPYADFYPTNARIIQIDSDPKHIGRRCKVDIGLHGYTDLTLEGLLPLVQQRSEQSFLESCRQKMYAWHRQQEQHEQHIVQSDAPVKPQFTAYQTGRLAEEDAIFLCDTGAVTAWAARHLPVSGEQRFTLSANLATMAFGLSGAIGAQLAYPERQVIALTGDGGFTMLMQDFLTAAKYALPINVVIFNNSKLGLIQIEQEARGNPEYQTHLHNPDFAAYAELCGGRGWSVDRADQLIPALEEAYATPLPCVIDVAIDQDELLMPPRVELGQALKYTLAKVKEYAINH